MGSESRHRDVRQEELARELARDFRLDATRAADLMRQAERAAVDDPTQRSIRQWVAILIDRNAGVDAPQREARQESSGSAPSGPGRQTLTQSDGEHDEPSGPQSLDLATRSRMGTAFNYDFNGVAIHRDSPLATGATRALVKNGEIHFRRGAYQPGTPAGERLIAHELAHVVQQRGILGTRPGERRDLEREADRAATLVTRGRVAPIALRAAPGATYAFSDDEDHDDGGGEHEAPANDNDGLEPGSDPSAPKVSRSWLETIRGSAGRPLPETLRKRLEVALKTDLGDVRIHDGAASDAAAQKINAKAFTIGKDIHFAQGRFDPSSRTGQELIAHEVAHAAQHRGGGDLSTATVSTPGEHHEVEAEKFASDFVRAEADNAAAPVTQSVQTTASRGSVKGPTGPRGASRSSMVLGPTAPAFAPMAAAPMAAPSIASIGSVSTGSVSRAVVYRDGGDKPPPAPKPPAKKKSTPPAVQEPAIDKSEVAKKAKEANDPEQDKKDKEKFEKENPQAAKDTTPTKKVPPPAAIEVPKPAAKDDKGATAKKEGGGEKNPIKAPPKKGAPPAVKPPAAPAAKGPAEAAVCAAADQDVGKFWATAQKDPAANDVSKRSKEMWTASQGLETPEADDMVGSLNPLTAVYNNGLAESDLGKAVLAPFVQGQGPYAEFNNGYRQVAQVLGAVRDITFNVSNVLGKIGLVLTVVGFILSLFGVGAILIAIGRTISTVTFIMDIIAAVAGGLLVLVNLVQISQETDPYKKAKFAKTLIDDANKAASNLVNVALGSAKVGKIFGKILNKVGIGKLLTAASKNVGSALMRVYATVSRFFKKMAKKPGMAGKVGQRMVKGMKQVKANRAKVSAEVNARQTKKDAAKAAKTSKKSTETATTKDTTKTAADTDLAGAKAKKDAADGDLQTKQADAKAKKDDLDTKAADAKSKKTDLESARTAEAQAKKTSRAADADLAKAEKAKAQAASAKKTKDAAAERSAEQTKAATEAAEKAKAGRETAVAAETTAKEAAEAAAKAEKAAAEAADNAKAAADRAKNAAGGDAASAAKAAEEAKIAAADASKAADDLARANQQKLSADKQAQLAKDGAETAAKAEKLAADAKTKAAADADVAAKSQAAADKRAADAQRSAAEAQAAAKKADADVQAATKAKQEADLAATEKARAEHAKKIADDAAKKKIEADQAASKAKTEADAAAQQKAAAEKAATDRAAAEQKAVEAKKQADVQKAEAATAKQKADKLAAESQAKSVEAQKQKADADAQVKRDQADLAKKEAAVQKAQKDRAAAEAKEAANNKAAADAKAREDQAVLAKNTADQKLLDDTKVAQEKAAVAKTQRDLYDANTKAAKAADGNSKAANEAAAKAERASKTADTAQKDAEVAAERAKKGQDDAQTKQADAEKRANEAGVARDKARDDAAKAQKAADDADALANEARAHKDATDTGDPANMPPGKTPRVERADETKLGETAKAGVSYGVGQMQQELATKNDGRDSWGTSPRWDLDPSKSPIPRAPRMQGLRATNARSVNVSDSVAKIFAKKVDDQQQQPATQPAAPGGQPAAAEPAVAPGDAGAAGAAESGPIPYWPELTKTYSYDLGAMTDARKNVQKYKTAQQKALATTRDDLKVRAAEIRKESAARKEPVAQNNAGLKKDAGELKDVKGNTKKQLEEDDKNEKERTKGEQSGQEGSDAATQAAAAEPPPAKGWWGKIKAAANWVLKNTLGRAMKFVTDAITNSVLFVIKHALGMDIKEMANYGQTAADAGTAKAGEGTADTTAAGETSGKTEGEAATEDMTLGQKIAAGEKNIKDADDFEKAIDEQEKTIQAEIKACNDFVKQVEAQFAKCKAEAEQAKAAPPPAQAQDPAANPDGGATNPDAGATNPDAGADAKDPEMEALLREAQTLCTGSIDAEIANLNALNAKGASLLHASAGNDPGEVAEADRLAGEVERGALKSAIAKLEGLRGKVGSGNEEAITAAASAIDAACTDGADAVIDAYVAAEQELLATPPAPPPAQTGAWNPHQPQP